MTLAGVAVSRSAAADALRNKLSRHRTLRKLTLPKACTPDVENVEEDTREDIEAQRRVSVALARYSEAVALALEALLHAQEALEDSGICCMQQAAPIAESLLIGLRRAQAATREVAKAVVVPLGVHAATLEHCVEDIARADKATAEVRWYSDKMDVITDSECEDGVSARLEPRLARNREKLTAVKRSASILQYRAKDAVGKCRVRRADLEGLAHKAVSATAEAFRCVVQDLRPELEVNAAAAAGDAWNPFESDVVPDPTNPFSGGDSASREEWNPFTADVEAPGPALPAVDRKTEVESAGDGQQASPEVETVVEVQDGSCSGGPGPAGCWPW